jgi:pSer/pThr/pTyr-binding forkhead associated (FHA) protein
MPKMIVSIDGVVIKEVQLTKDRTTIGRRPYNDIVIDNLAVSGEHAAILMQGGDVYIEDLGSTNGTFINGKAVKKQQLENNDTIEVGKYKIKFIHEKPVANFEKTMIVRPGTTPPVAATPTPPPVVAAPPAPAVTTAEVPAGSGASIKVLSGAAAGRQVPLIKVVTTIGKPGVAVAAITKRPSGYVIALIEGTTKPTINSAPIGTDPITLNNGDLLDLAGTQMQFVQG